LEHNMLTSVPLPTFKNHRIDRRAFFVTYGASHIAKIAPVIRELEIRGIECLVMALTIGHKKAKQMGLDPLGYRDFLPLLGERATDVLSIGESMQSGNTHPDVDLHETHCYLGINYLEWLDDLGEEAARAKYADRGRQGFMPVRFMGAVLDSLQPGLVVATSTPRTEEAAIRAAVQRGIPSLTMVDLFAPPSDPFLRRPIHAQRITVISEEVRERFLEHQLDSIQVVTTGSPDFDELFDPREELAAHAFLQAKGWLNRKVVLWAGILEPEHADLRGAELGLAVERVLREWVRSTPGTALIVRYHPGQYHEFPSLPPQDGVHVSIPGKESIAPLLHASNTVIHQVSTVGLQAALLGKRVLHLGFSAWVQAADFDLSSLGNSEAVDSLLQLRTKLDAEDAVASCRRMRVPSGPAAPRVADVAQQLLDLPNEKYHEAN
jgi:hypothetical protein